MKMKTYVVESDGKPVMAFRARDDEHAASFPDRLRSSTSPLANYKPEGKLTVRLATIPERAKWTAESVEDQDDDSADDYDADSVVVRLDWEEKK